MNHDARVLKRPHSRRKKTPLVSVQRILHEKYNHRELTMRQGSRQPKQYQAWATRAFACLVLVVLFFLAYMLIKTFPRSTTPPLQLEALSEANHLAETFAEATPDQLADMPSDIVQTALPTPVLTPQPKDETPPPQTPTVAHEQPIKTSPWTRIKTQPRDTLGRLFNRLGLSQRTLLTLLHDTPHAKALTNIKPNQELQVLIENGNLMKLVFPLNAAQRLFVEKVHDHYVSRIQDLPTEMRPLYTKATLQGSLYGTAKRLNIPYKLIQQMVSVFTWDIDLSRNVRPGDQFSMLYEGFFIHDRLVNTGHLLAVTYTHHGQTHEAIRHVDAHGTANYYTPQGLSLTQAFSRYPVQFSHISSTFSLSRRHPILHYNRPHKGIDLAAPMGTPIHATGDGRIEMIGRHNGFGNMIKLSHNKIYASIYGHMLRFQKGLTKGMWVKRGQVIGYVGQSGLASGPHCHYEFHVNHTPRNPATVDLPRALPIAPRESLAFKAIANQRLATLKQPNTSNKNVAVATSKTKKG